MSDPAATPREHKATAPQSIGCWVLTISDSKTPDTDTSGTLIRELLAGAGHRVIGSEIVRDEPTDVQRVIREACANDAVRAVIMTGGTGITSRDSTFEAVEAMLDKRLPGFGELFRMLSYQEVGGAAMLSRAQMGVAERLPSRPREAPPAGTGSSRPRAEPISSAGRARYTRGARFFEEVG
jgi:molybdopterin adenylyltransferase